MISARHGGAFLCDGVGLGKTFVGLMLIERMVLRDGKRVVLFAPKAAREDVWERVIPKFLPHLNSRFVNFVLFNHTDLQRGGKDQWDVCVARTVSSHKAMSAYDTNSVFPFYLADDSESSQRSLASEHRINFSTFFLKSLTSVLDLQQKGAHDLPAALTPEDIFHYIYAVFHSPGYRTRYAEFLKIDFPRLPLTGNLELFRTLARLGGELTALHLLESPKLAHPLTQFIEGSAPEGPQGTKKTQRTFKASMAPGTPKSLESLESFKSLSTVEKPTYSRDTVWFDKAQTTGFQGVPEAVWNFHIGGYQVCEKWLKDRKGRTLTAEDIAHYHKIVVALSETIRLMAEIDETIAAHGGWPGAFLGAPGTSPA